MKSDSLRFRACIWDFDGTLFNSYPIMNRAMVEALETLSQPRPFEEVRRLMKQSVSTALTFYHEHFSLGKELETEFRRREKLLSDDLPPYDGALKLCRDITEAGGMNLLYTHRDSLSEAMLRRYGFTPFFAGGVTAEDGFPSKPAPDALEHLMKTFSFSPEEGLMIGDRDIDLLAGKNAGIAGYLFDPMDDYASFATLFRGHSMKEWEAFLFAP